VSHCRTLITNGNIVDGTGSDSYHADVMIEGDTIIGIVGPEEGTPSADLVIDATGKVVTPGFVDIHSHADFSILASPAAETQLHQGVTTLVTGNCGASPFPTRSTRDTEAEYAYLDADFTGDWESVSGYLEMVRAAQPAINLVPQLGHGSLRTYVMGREKRRPTHSELAEIRRQVDIAAADGIRGVSTGLIYEPGSFAAEKELMTLAAAAANNGLLYSSHMRNESDELIAAVRETIAVAEATGGRVQVSHLKAMGKPNHGAVDTALELLHEACRRGLDIAADVYPYTASSTRLSARLPDWAKHGGPETYLPRLTETTFRNEVIRHLESLGEQDLDPGSVVIAAAPGAINPTIADASGLSFLDLAQQMDCEPAEAMVASIEATGGRLAVVNHAMSRADLKTVIADELTSICSDGWTLATQGDRQPHPRSFGTYPTVIQEFVVAEPVLSLEEAVRKMTAAPAQRIGLTDRGTLRPGYKADIAVFDPLQLKSRSTFTDPWHLAEGIEHLFVNGQPAISQSVLAGVRTGQII
jgi:N-acyl-D-amino-acid deacylase